MPMGFSASRYVRIARNDVRWLRRHATAPGDPRVDPVTPQRRDRIVSPPGDAVHAGRKRRALSLLCDEPLLSHGGLLELSLLPDTAAGAHVAAAVRSDRLVPGHRVRVPGARRRDGMAHRRAAA